MSQSDQILRTGVLFKKGSGSGILGRKNWKPRYFVLTPSKLKYFTFEDGDLRGEVDLTGCDEGMVEVMPMDSMKTGSSASTIWRIAVNAPERRLLVAAGTEMEMNDWVDKLMMAFRINNGGPMHLPQRTSLTQAPNSLNNGFSNSGNGSLSGSMNGSNSTPGSGNGGTSITDFQNFTIARRMHHGGRQSMNSDFQRHSDEQLQQQQFTEQRRVELQRHADEEQEMAQRQHDESEQLRLEEMEREQAYQIEQTRRHEEAKREAAEAAARRQQQQAEEARRYHEEALRQQAEEEEQQRLALEQQLLAVEREREEERKRIEADKLLEQQRQSQEAMLEQQRRLKREKHERERAEREQQMREAERQAELERQKAQLAAQESFSFDQSESGEEYDLDEEEEVAPVPRSSLIGEVKREAMMKQQAEHQRRREVALKEEQRRQRDLEFEKKMASVQLNAGSHHQQPRREVEIPSRVVEVVRRAPPAAKAPEETTPATRLSIQEKTESVEF